MNLKWRYFYVYSKRDTVVWSFTTGDIRLKFSNQRLHYDSCRPILTTRKSLLTRFCTGRFWDEYKVIEPEPSMKLQLLVFKPSNKHFLSGFRHKLNSATRKFLRWGTAQQSDPVRDTPHQIISRGLGIGWWSGNVTDVVTYLTWRAQRTLRCDSGLLSVGAANNVKGTRDSWTTQRATCDA